MRHEVAQLAPAPGTLASGVSFRVLAQPPNRRPSAAAINQCVALHCILPTSIRRHEILTPSRSVPTWQYLRQRDRKLIWRAAYGLQAQREQPLADLGGFDRRRDRRRKVVDRRRGVPAVV